MLMFKGVTFAVDVGAIFFFNFPAGSFGDFLHKHLKYVFKMIFFVEDMGCIP